MNNSFVQAVNKGQRKRWSDGFRAGVGAAACGDRLRRRDPRPARRGRAASQVYTDGGASSRLASRPLTALVARRDGAGDDADDGDRYDPHEHRALPNPTKCVPRRGVFAFERDESAVMYRYSHSAATGRRSCTW